MASEKVKSEYEKQLHRQRLMYWARIIRDMNDEALADPWNYDFHGEYKKLLDENPRERNLIAEARKRAYEVER
jgi:hypothetical protein